jgi:hypothetical protein
VFVKVPAIFLTPGWFGASYRPNNTVLRFELLPPSARLQLPESLIIVFNQVNELIPPAMGRGECHHEGLVKGSLLDELVLCFAQLLPSPFGYLGRADWTHPN